VVAIGSSAAEACRPRRTGPHWGRLVLGTLNSILSESQPQVLPAFDADAFDAPERYRYGARSEAAAYVGDLLSEEVPQLAPLAGTLEMVAIARRPGVLTKVAVRPRPGSTAATIGADHLTRVRARLDGERIHVVAWQRSASAYIADALELGHIPPVVLLAGIGHARVLLGEIDVRGIAGWRGLNTVLASALTGWRIRLEPVAATAAWRRLHAAMLARRPLTATVVSQTARGPRVELLGLYALLPRRVAVEPGQDVQVRITRMDPDEGRIFVSDRLVATGQLPLL
jgi:transcription antitermination factor NusA-like protein